MPSIITPTAAPNNTNPGSDTPVAAAAAAAEDSLTATGILVCSGMIHGAGVFVAVSRSPPPPPPPP